MNRFIDIHTHLVVRADSASRLLLTALSPKRQVLIMFNGKKERLLKLTNTTEHHKVSTVDAQVPVVA